MVGWKGGWGYPAGAAAATPQAYPPPGGPPYTHPALAAPPPDAIPVIPVDPMAFPPGLLPKLVDEKLQTDPPYSPLSPLEVEQAGLPSQGEPDAYLKSRLQRFYAELQVQDATIVSSVFCCIVCAQARSW